MVEDRLLTVPEVARRLRVSRSTAYLLVQRGELPVVRLGPRLARVRARDLEAFLEARARREGGEAAP